MFLWRLKEVTVHHKNYVVCANQDFDIFVTNTFLTWKICFFDLRRTLPSTFEKTRWSTTYSVVQIIYGWLIWVYTKYRSSFYTSEYLSALYGSYSKRQIYPNLIPVKIECENVFSFEIQRSSNLIHRPPKTKIHN